MEEQNQSTGDNKGKNSIIALLFIGLVALGAYFVYKIPPAPSIEDQLSQLSESSDNIDTLESGETLGVETAAPQNMDNKLIIEDITVGTGPEAIAGKKITVNYSGTLTDGTKFDSSYDRNEPFSFSLGAGEVIAGWDQGFSGMKVGGKRKLTIPPSLGYGAADLGTIPPNSTLVFTVELLGVE